MRFAGKGEPVLKLWQAIITGIVYGFADLLPLSGAGHMKILERILALPPLGSSKMLLLNGMLHLGTALAVIVSLHRYISFRPLPTQRIRQSDRRQRRISPGHRLVQLIFVGALPALLGLLVHDKVTIVSDHLSWVGGMLIVNGLILFFAARYAYGSRDEKDATIADALLIGLSQVLAVVPGISRIGVTATVGMWRDLKAEFAVVFAYLLSAPVSIGIAVMNITRAVQLGGVTSADLPMCLVAMVATTLSGYAAVQITRLTAWKNAFGKFAYVSWSVGIIALALVLFFA